MKRQELSLKLGSIVPIYDYLQHQTTSDQPVETCQFSVLGPILCLGKGPLPTEGTHDNNLNKAFRLCSTIGLGLHDLMDKILILMYQLKNGKVLFTFSILFGFSLLPVVCFRHPIFQCYEDVIDLECCLPQNDLTN